MALGILTADCVPVLFYAEKADGRPLVGAAHAGWGGALKGVLESTVRPEKLGVALLRDQGVYRSVYRPCIL
ncbi:MAG: laccase domain-containing protein [Alphaproteobacteria bacterium]